MSSETVYLLLPEIILVLVATRFTWAARFCRLRAGWSWLAAGGDRAGRAWPCYQQQGDRAAVASMRPPERGLLSGPLLIDQFSHDAALGDLGRRAGVRHALVTLAGAGRIVRVHGLAAADRGRADARGRWPATWCCSSSAWS